MVQRVNVQVFVFCKNPCFKVLILKRTPERSGYWQPVCGGVETEENFIETVLREVWEETGISNIKLIRDLEYTFEYEEPKNGVLLDMQDFCFTAEVEDIPKVKLSEEHEEYKWCSYDEAKEHLTWEHNLIALEKLINNI